MTVVEAPEGLEGVVVTRTAISDIDGETGRLTYRGCPLEDIVSQYGYEDILAYLTELRREPPPQMVKAGDVSGDPMARLVTVLMTIPYDPQRPLTYIQMVALHLAATRHQVADPGFGSLAYRYLTLLRNNEPSPREATALDTYWVTAAEHSLNASTFAVRIAASTGAPLPMALAAGAATLSGPLHGGAPTGVVQLLREARESGDVATLLRRKVDAGERLMGFGHRVYRTTDPRARILRQLCESLPAARDSATIAKTVEQEALKVLRDRHPDRPLATNVEFYAGVLLYSLGIDAAWCPPTFAVARMAGWTAHYFEQRQHGRLIRPLARYQPPM
ncbi:MAG: citrate synthase [Firmicutes bacterium]|nr:citrate synthase [Bacillota bacterium]